MDHLDFSQHDGLLEFPASTYINTDENRAQTYPPAYHSQQQHQPTQTAWVGQVEGEIMSQHQYVEDVRSHQRMSRPANSQMQQAMSLQTGRMHMVPNAWHLQFNQAALAQHEHQQRQHRQRLQQQRQQQQRQQQNAQATQQEQLQQFAAQQALETSAFAAYANQLQTSPTDLTATAAFGTVVPSTVDNTAAFMSIAGPMESMHALSYPLHDYQLDMHNALNMNLQALQHQTADNVPANVSSGSPTGTILEVQSLSDNDWTAITFNPNRQSLDSLGTVSNPSQNLHIRTNSDSSSSGPDSAQLSGSYEEIPPWPLSSPQDEFYSQNYIDSHFLQRGLPIPGTEQHQHQHQHQHHTSPSSTLAVSPSSANAATFPTASASSTSPSSSSGSTSPPLRRRKSPSDKVAKVIVKKSVTHTTRKDNAAEKKVGKRRGPLRPDQRQQAHEIRKLRACLRCKFLKKTCDKGEPCGGCRPSHARLWQVPCTRLDIKDISYFMKDWKADYERHVSLGFSVHNIKGFSTIERTLYITHGYGHYIPIKAREVYVREDKCFDVNWVESLHESPLEFEVNTAKLSAGIEGVSTAMLSEYLDNHLDSGFESFVDEYFEGTVFLTEILKTVYNYYQKAKTPAIRKALKLVLAYNLTLHLTMVEGLPVEETFAGRIDDPTSKFNGKTFAPVMINFQIKCALADMSTLR